MKKNCCKKTKTMLYYPGSNKKFQIFKQTEGIQMIEITNLRQGAILNSTHGEETETSLTIPVEGISETGHPVVINGMAAEMEGRRFSLQLPLTEKINSIKAQTVTPHGVFSQELTVVWDKKSFKRYNFYIDDHSFLFTDLAKERPVSAFDHFYLKALKEIHRKYGLKLTLNAFYENAHHGFELKDMPDTWKSEFIDNSDWLKFSFHSKSEFPDRPYAEASAEDIGREWDMVQNEICRFAGEESYITPVVFHWASIHPAAAQEAIKRGLTCYSRGFRLRVMGGPSLADRQQGGNMQLVEKRALSGEDRSSGTLEYQLHYDIAEEDSYLKKHFAYYDPFLQVYFFQHIHCCNLIPLDKTREKIETALTVAEKYGTHALACGSHEQYSFPYYPNYLPDHLERLELTAKVMAEHGYHPVFFPQGVMGNPAWDIK